jgi:hypothetical protein
MDEFYAAARAELVAEAEADLHRRTVERAQRLRGEAQRQQAGTAIPTDPAGLRTLLDEKRALLAHVDAKPGWARSATEDRARDVLRQDVYDLELRLERVGAQPAGTVHIWPSNPGGPA